MGYERCSHAAEISLSPHEEALFVTNRGHDSVAQFGLDSEGAVTGLLQHVASGGCLPWSMDFDTTSGFVIVQNQYSLDDAQLTRRPPKGTGRVVTFKFNGRLEHTDF